MKIPESLGELAVYFFVGLGATAVEWSCFYLFDMHFHIHYTVAVAMAFLFSTFANWGLGRLMLFKKGDPRGLLHELVAIYGVSSLGLLANLAIMWGMIDCLKVPDMPAKIAATGIVFLGNFLVRKFWIYKR